MVPTQLAHGILPPAFTRGGLRAGVVAFVERVDLPVQVDVPDERYPTEIEASAYFIVAEALTNVVKHSHARAAKVTASVQHGMLRVEIRDDDGSGGANPTATGWSGCATGSRPSADGSRSTARPAAARAWPRRCHSRPGRRRLSGDFW